MSVWEGREMKQILTGVAKVVKSSDGTYVMRASSLTVDRDGEVVDTRGMETSKRVCIYADHLRTMSSVLGSGSLTKVGDGDLDVAIKFLDMPLANVAKAMLDDPDHSEALGCSITAVGSKRELAKGVPTWTGGEIIEVSITGIPANTDTGLLAIKTIDGEEILTKGTGIPGAMQDVIEKVRAAVGKVESGWPRMVATTADTVIYTVYDYEKDTDITYQRTWSDSDGEFTLSEAVEVNISAVVTPVGQSATTKKNAEPTPEPIPAVKAVEVPGVDSAAIPQHNVTALRARIALALSQSVS
jgi:hypothetical protein